MDALAATMTELKAFPLFEGFALEEIHQLCEGGRVIMSQHREIIFRFGESADYFGIVLNGAYKLLRPSPSGEDVIVHFSTPGDAVAAFIMAQKSPVYPVSAIAMGPSRFLKIPRQNYLTSWQKNNALILRVQSLLSTRMSYLQNEKALNKAPLNEKVASLLLSLLEKSGDPKGLILPLPLTRKEIADKLGASVESVIRVMSEWSKQGVISTTEQHIQVVRPDKIIDLLKVK